PPRPAPGTLPAGHRARHAPPVAAQGRPGRHQDPHRTVPRGGHPHRRRPARAGAPRLPAPRTRAHALRPHRDPHGLLPPARPRAPPPPRAPRAHSLLDRHRPRRTARAVAEPPPAGPAPPPPHPPAAAPGVAHSVDPPR